MGGGGCRATPVIDGLVCNMSQRRNGRGGEWLSEIQLQILKQVNEIPDIQHRHMLKMKEQRKRQETTTTESNPLNEAEGSAALLDSQYNSSLFHRLALLELMYEIKTGDHVNVPESSFEEGSRGTRLQYPTKKQKMEKEGMILNDQSSDVNDKQIYELPDGTIIDLDNSEGSGILCDLPVSVKRQNFILHSFLFFSFLSNHTYAMYKSTGTFILCRSTLLLEAIFHSKSIPLRSTAKTDSLIYILSGYRCSQRTMR